MGRRVGLDDPQRSLPTPTILRFCDSRSPERARGVPHAGSVHAPRAFFCPKEPGAQPVPRQPAAWWRRQGVTPALCRAEPRQPVGPLQWWGCLLLRTSRSLLPARVRGQRGAGARGPVGLESAAPGYGGGSVPAARHAKQGPGDCTAIPYAEASRRVGPDDPQRSLPTPTIL